MNGHQEGHARAALDRISRYRYEARVANAVATAVRSGAPRSVRPWRCRCAMLLRRFADRLAPPDAMTTTAGSRGRR